ncbi:hypothetical protein [Streptomyces sp. NPDC004050]
MSSRTRSLVTGRAVSKASAGRGTGAAGGAEAVSAEPALAAGPVETLHHPLVPPLNTFCPATPAGGLATRPTAR